MNSRSVRYIAFALGACGLIAYLTILQPSPAPSASTIRKVRSTSSPKAPIESKRGRAEYFFRMLRDPATNTVPTDIRRRELAYARTLPRRDVLSKPTDIANGGGFTWTEVGPTDVGGRTRALAVDINNSATIIAGGVSGGIWKSTDSGQTWVLKTPMNVPLSVSYIAQDPRDGQTNTWYYTTGEFQGSADDFSGNAQFFGSGIYKSTDNGETWLFLSSTLDDKPTQFNGPFDYISKIVVHPGNGFLYIVSNGFGIYRSTNGGASFDLSLGGLGQHRWCDIEVGANDALLATISEASAGSPSQDNSPGVYRSTDNGDNWTDITPTAFPQTHDRSVIAIAPSNRDIAYILTFGNTSQNSREVVTLFKVTSIANGTFEDRSAGIPDFGDPVGMMDTQGSYNMVVAVKPDDPDFVLIGGTNLFRSTNGFDTQSSNKNKTWVGGYAAANDIDQYVNQHADQHVAFFDPENPDILWAGHDGGISLTTDVTAEPMVWEDKNSGYNVTQFYTVTIPAQAGNTNIIGGTQDNGSPAFDWENPQDGSEDITTGDGSFAYFGQQFIYASAQEGEVGRYELDGSFRAGIKPSGTSGQLFIHPFAVDPTNETVMYYPVDNEIWRNIMIHTEPDGSTGWTPLSNIKTSSSLLISALAVSKSNPSNRLYFAGSNSTKPEIWRLDNAISVTSGAQDISIPAAVSGAYVHNIAVNPINGDEILVVMSNYNIIGLYHSSDGGANYTAVEGNLEGSNSDGPSLRWGAILPVGTETQYLVATSVGLFSTTTLNGMNTMWLQEGADIIGNTVVAALDARTSDNTVAAATHGRGIFIGTSAVSIQTVQSDTSTVAFNAPDGSKAAVKFNAGVVSGNTVTYQNHGRALPISLPGDQPPSIPVQYFTLNSTIPDTTGFEALVTVVYTQAQLDSAGVNDESTLTLFRFNEEDSTWQQLSTTVDETANTAAAPTTAFSSWALASAMPTGIAEASTGQTLPLSYALEQNYPNPFNPATTIRYVVPKDGHVRLVIYNVAGQRVRMLIDAAQPAGRYRTIWDGANAHGQAVASGVYLYRLSTDNFSESKRMTLLR